jgi:general secretion pathway protein F
MLSSLSFRIRADLYVQLAALEQAGLPTNKAFDMLDLPKVAQPRVAKMRAALARRMPIAAAGRHSGLFTELDATLIRAATEAGSPAVTYRRLADYYAQRALQVAAIKARLTLPLFVMVAGLFIQPLPALLNHAISPGGYFLRSVGSLCGLIVVGALAMLLRDRLQGAPRTLSRMRIERILLRLPVFGAMHLRRNVRDFVESLALLLEAGVPILDALPKATDTMQNSIVRAEFERIRPAIERGATLTQAMSSITFITNSQAIGLIHTGETSGTLPDMLFHYARAETHAINQFSAQMALWIPRLVYAVIAVWIAYGILNGAGVGTTVPVDL